MPQPEVWEAQFRTWQSRTIFTSSLSFLRIQFGNKPCGMCFETSPRLDLSSLFPPSLPQSEPSPRHASQPGSLPPGSPGHPQCCLISLPKSRLPQDPQRFHQSHPISFYSKNMPPPLVQEFLYLPRLQPQVLCSCCSLCLQCPSTSPSYYKSFPAWSL